MKNYCIENPNGGNML
jgi:hypothetical protein